MTKLCVRAERDGAILCETGLSGESVWNWFEPEWWQEQGKLGQRAGGRGGNWFVDTPRGPCVLRHFHRGGQMARLLADRYLWPGGDSATRGFSEFHLLCELRERELPVPEPVAARYRRRGLFYTADLLTRKLPGITLARRLAEGTLDQALGRRLGALLARFHRHGVFHADLNAHNILVDDSELHLIDFDRGSIRPHNGAWREANLARLLRSLRKLGAGGPSFEHEFWRPLKAAYAAGWQT